MADRRPDPDNGDDPDVGAARGPIMGAPRWVKVFGIIVGVLVLLFIVLQVVGGVEHGPRRHTSDDVDMAPWPLAAPHAPSQALHW